MDDNWWSEQTKTYKDCPALTTITVFIQTTQSHSRPWTKHHRTHKKSTPKWAISCRWTLDFNILLNQRAPLSLFLIQNRAARITNTETDVVQCLVRPSELFSKVTKMISQVLIDVFSTVCHD